MRKTRLTLLLIALAIPATLGAQIGLPLPTPAPLPSAGDVIGRVTGALDADLLDTLPRADALERLAAARVTRLRSLVRANPERIELDDMGAPAVRGRLLLGGDDPALIARAQAAGFALIGQETVEGLDIGFATLAPPRGMSLARAVRALRRIAPGAEVSADPLYEPSGAGGPGPARAPLAPDGDGGGAPPLGLIDGGIASHPTLPAALRQRGFAAGAPHASAHGTAVASLLVGNGAVRGAAAGSPLLAADAYGTDPAGGNATAIAHALGWLTVSGARTVTISLVGPPNMLLQRTVAAAQKRGVSIVAAVGNDGPAAPPAYPASYPGVVAVTGVDGRNRALIEAGRSLHLDFAAPGADMLAARAAGGTMAVRGTSFAAPLAAARLHRLGGDVRALAREAVDLGAKGPDKAYGRGLVCGDCRTVKR